MLNIRHIFFSIFFAKIEIIMKKDYINLNYQAIGFRFYPKGITIPSHTAMVFSKMRFASCSSMRIFETLAE